MPKRITAAAFVIVILCFGIYRAFFGGFLLMVGDFTGSDLLDMHLPYKNILHDAVSQGRLPLWTDALNNGMPFLAEGQAGILYPLNLLLALIDPADSLMLGILLAVLVAGLGMFGYLRSGFGLPAVVALFGSVAFAGSSVMLFRAKHFNYINAISLLPFVFWMLLLWWRTEQKKYGVGLAIVLSLIVYTGAPPFLYYALLFMWVYVVCHILIALFKREDCKFRKRLVGLVWICMLAGLWSLPQVLPTLEYSFYTSRSGGNDNYLSNIAYPFNPMFYLTLFNPYIFGNPAVGTYTLPISSFGVWWENVLYVGLLPLALILLGLVWLWRNHTRRKPSFLTQLDGQKKRELVVLGILCLFFGYVALGGMSLLHMFLHTILPGFDYFRFPQRMNVLVVFVGCVFASVVLDKCLSGLVQKKKLSSVWMNLIGAVFVVGLLVDYIVVYNQYFYMVTAESYQEVKPPMEILQTTDRIYSLVQYYVNPYAAGWKASTGEVLDVQYGMPGDNVARFGVDSFSNRNWFEGGLVLRSKVEYEEDLLFNYSGDCEGFERQLRVWGVRYVAGVENNDLVYGEVPDLGCMEVIDRRGDYVWREIDGVWDRKYLAVAGDEDGMRIPLIQESTDRGSERSFKVSVGENMLMVISEYDYPGWEVRINGQMMHKYSHPLGKKAVEVPAGDSLVEWRYVPWSFYVGVLGWFAGIGLVIAWIAVSRKSESKA